MKYKITIEKEAKVSAATSLAIQKFKDILKAELKIERLKGELAMWIREIPNEEFGTYVEITEQMSDDLEV